MKPNFKTATCLLVVITLTTLLIIKAQKHVKSDDKPDVAQFPTVEYSGRKALTEKQQTRSRKYNSRAPAITEDTKIFLISDWDLRLPALPVKVSTAVIIGDVTDAQAFLSEDQSKIYSEFNVQIRRVLKNDIRTPLEMGTSVILERSGGRVRFPSGKIAISATNHQDLPRVGDRYLFFLTHEGPDARNYDDFHILTGYELRNGQVFPLDKPGPGAAYKGTSETSFLNELAVALADTLSQTK